MGLAATNIYLSWLTGNNAYGGTEKTLVGSGVAGTTATADTSLSEAGIGDLSFTAGFTRVYISGDGCNAGWYTVESRDSANKVILDSDPGNSGGSSVVWNMGGPLKGDFDLPTALVLADHVHILADATYLLTTNTWDFDNSSIEDVVIQGYGTTILDGVDADLHWSGADGIVADDGLILVDLDVEMLSDHTAVDIPAGLTVFINDCVFTCQVDSGDNVLVGGVAGGYLIVDDSVGSCVARDNAGGYHDVFRMTGGTSHGYFTNVTASCIGTAAPSWKGYNVEDKAFFLNSVADGADKQTDNGNGFYVPAGCDAVAVHCSAHDCLTAGLNGIATKKCKSHGNGTDFLNCIDLGDNLEAEAYEIEVSEASSVSVFRNDTPTLVLSVVDSLGIAVPLEGLTLTLGCRREIASESYVFSKADGDFDKALIGDGIVKVDLVAADTAELLSSGYLELQGAWNNRVRTLLTAVLSVTADIVRA